MGQHLRTGVRLSSSPPLIKELSQHAAVFFYIHDCAPPSACKKILLTSEHTITYMSKKNISRR